MAQRALKRRAHHRSAIIPHSHQAFLLSVMQEFVWCCERNVRHRLKWQPGETSRKAFAHERARLAKGHARDSVSLAVERAGPHCAADILDSNVSVRTRSRQAPRTLLSHGPRSHRPSLPQTLRNKQSATPASAYTANILRSVVWEASSQKS